ncbi:carboxylesterase/lipase family protein [Aeromicrobium sp. YIM 150415]|uniref:carboxylesterase/lipase family protein n=1 Tax=Aeromicrobium sp. YIM 150415 TaxID=2803912 RepID=UPI0019664EEA|nr:carboxylesterase family protein [Aeromicrobium sp. YIM 150415]
MDVTIAQGAFRGAPIDGTSEGRTFKGIPYASAPIGDLRWAEPRPPQQHDGTADATRYGPTVSTPPQRSQVLDELIPDPSRPGENGLNLNIWSPDISASAPVFVWIHGGGFATGAGSTSAFDGSAFARDGVVAVTINYRLAAEGFLHLPGAPGNRGLLDMVAALEWVRDNIAAFGGDPDRVTIAGESAGAMAVCTLLAVPRARGLFHRAIVQSGSAHHVHPLERAELVAPELAAELGVEATVAGFSAVPVEELHAATNTVIGRLTSGQDPRFAEFRRLAFQPVIDGDVLPEHPIDAIAAGAGAGVDLLIGTNADEYGLFVGPTGMADKLTEEMLVETTRRLVDDPADLVDMYRAERPGATPAELFVALQSDWFCVAPADRLLGVLRAAGRPVHSFQFAWNPPTYEGMLGACHTLEIPFVFDTLRDPWGRALRGADAPQSLADEMHAAWVAFVRDGDPGWPEYGDRRRVRRLDVSSTTVEDPLALTRQIWDGRPL